MTKSNSYDVAVIGSGVFGAWTAWHLTRRKLRVLLIDTYGPAHSRASSGGESRIIRMSYGADEIYTRWSSNSLKQWKTLFAATGNNLFEQTGVLGLAGKNDTTLRESASILKRNEIPHETLDCAQLKFRYPQIDLENISRGLFEPLSGVLLARRAVAAVVNDARLHGAQFQLAHVLPPPSTSNFNRITTSQSESISASQFVFACGPWLGKVFPDLLANRIFPTRQEVFFFGIPPGDVRFIPPNLPTWLFQEEEFYGMPDIEARGLKLAHDIHGEAIDPDTQSRIASQQGADAARNFLARRFPALRDAPIVETRVCQYENTSNGDFLIDRHPQWPNVWLAGGGSGHGFKHGPAFGEYLAAQICGEGQPEPRFSLSSKATQQRRAVF
jgi:sarcosine oxidase